MKKIAAFIISLSIIDQIIKLIIYNFLDDRQTDLIFGFLHIHPRFNDVSILEKKLNTNFPALMTGIIITVGIFVIILFYRYLLYMSKKWRKLSTLFICFFMAGALCSCIDQIFFGGSLDYICFTWEGSDLRGSFTIHFYFDLKDIYLTLGGILFLVRSIIFVFDYIYKYYKLNKEERKKFDFELKNDFINWLKTGFPTKRVE